MDSERKFDVVQAFSQSFNGLSSENNLHRASRCGDCDLINKILDGNAPLYTHFDDEEEKRADNKDEVVNERNRLGCTPLWLATSMGHEEAVKLLIQRKAKLEIEDVKAQTPLFAATKFNRISIVELLLCAEANPNGSMNNVSSPLHVAARENFLEVLTLLLHHGANVDGRDSLLPPEDLISRGRNGTTPLHMTLVYRHYDCFRLLLKFGASLTILDSSCLNERSSLTVLAAILKYACDINYAKLFVMCGGLLYVQQSQVKRLIGNYQDIHLPTSRELCIKYISQMSVRPLKLKQLSRIRIREMMGQKRFNHINHLQIPQLIKFYLLLSCMGW